MVQSRQILHINIVGFYTAVAVALEPKLASYPLAVATQGRQRQVVLDMSAEAFAAGVRRNMLLADAQRRCADLVVLKPAPDAYERANNALIQESLRLSPCVESAGPGHVFIDLTGTQRLWGHPVDVAEKMRKTMKSKYNLSPAAGLAANKLVSKIATRVIKPAGFCSVLEGCEEDFMDPLPVHLLPGIEYEVIRKLIQFNILLVSELLVASAAEMEKALGKAAQDIQNMARGIDNTPVREYESPLPAVQERVVLREQTNDDAVIKRELFGAVERAGARIRKMGYGTQKIGLLIAYSDGAKEERCCALGTPVNGDLTLYAHVEKLLRSAYTRRVRLAWIAVEMADLCSPYGQLDLFDDTESERKLMQALDSVRGKFGTGRIVFGREKIIRAFPPTNSAFGGIESPQDFCCGRISACLKNKQERGRQRT